MTSTKEKIKKIILSHGHGLPDCPDEIQQCDWWQECATEILDGICSELGFYQQSDEEE